MRNGRTGSSLKILICLLYTSDAADDLTRVDLGGGGSIKKKKFLVLTVGATSGLPVALADRLLGALHEPPLRAGAETVTASMGLAVSYEGVAHEKLLREADAAMYHAKRAG